MADLKSSCLYECLPELGNMTILSETDTSAYILYEQFTHHTHINLSPNKEPLGAQHHAFQSLLSHFLLIICFRHCGMQGDF